MAEPRALLLHVGAGKCGSTALQTSLSLQPEFTGSGGRRYAYAVIDTAGRIAQGADLTRAATRSPLGYCSSLGLTGSGQIERLLAGLQELAKGPPDVTPVLSSEGWLAKTELFKAQAPLTRAGFAADVVIYVRPPLDWLNSAWWQWGAWSGQGRADWMAAHVNTLRWERHLRRWQHVPGVAAAQVRLATGDVVADFAGLLGAGLAPVGRANVSGDGGLLRMMQRWRILRRSPEDPRLEFFFARWAPGPRWPVPWVIPHDEGAAILEEIRNSTERLLDLVAPEQAALIHDDPRWWSVAPYRDRPVAAEGPPPLRAAELRAFVGRAARAWLNRRLGRRPNP